MFRSISLALALAVASLPAQGKEDGPRTRFTLRASTIDADLPAEPPARFRLKPVAVPDLNLPPPPRFSLLSLPVAKGGEECAPAESIFRNGFED